MPQRRRASAAPWITAAVAGAVLAALLVVYYALLLPYRRDHPVGEFTSSEAAAMAAATTEVENLGTMNKSNFDQHYNLALQGATGAFKQDLLRDRSAAQQNIAAAKVTGEVTHSALVGPSQDAKSPNGYVILETFGRSSSDLASLLQAPQQVSVTVVNLGGKWLVSDIASVGIA